MPRRVEIDPYHQALKDEGYFEHVHDDVAGVVL
jgi:hypothetical protein